jgi:hypothetical protein
MALDPVYPPVLFVLAGILPRGASIVNLTYILGGSNKLEAALA